MSSSASRTSFRSIVDRGLGWWLRGSAVLAGTSTLLVALFVGKEALPAMRHVGITRFFADASWHPVEGTFGVLPMLVGSLATTAGAIAIAAPLGIVVAVFCRHYAPAPVARVYRGAVELFAGVPSVVFGFWGLVVLVPMIARIKPPGASLLAAVLVLSMMILPTVALLADSALAQVPHDLVRGAAALGLTKASTVRRVILPAARSGLTAAVILAVGRAIGETMAVLMVAGNVVQMPKSIFDPIRTLPSNVALEMAYALGDHRSALFVTGLALVGLVVIVMVSAGLAGRSAHAP